MRVATVWVVLAAAATAQEVPDFSHAGYRAGEEPPRREATRTVEALPFTAKEGEVIRIPPGRFELREVLEIRTDRVVLQGAGSDKTTLVCPNSLTDLKGPNRSWSWSGGMIDVRPPPGKEVVVGHVNVEPVPAGTTRFKVAWRRWPEDGQWRLLKWLGDYRDDLHGGVMEDVGTDGREVLVREWIRCSVKDGADVEIDRPLRLAIDPRALPAVEIVHRPCIREVGIEGLLIEFPETPYPGHLKEKGYNGIHIADAIDCWVRDVVIVNADSGIFVNNCKRVTVQDVKLEGRPMHHGLSASWSSDCLFDRWRIEAPHVHGTTISWAAHGNVFSRGWGRSLAMDAHRAAPFENLHTEIVSEYLDAHRWSPLRSGGSKERGPHAARSNVYWNVELRFPGRTEPFTMTGHDEWPLGIFVGWHANVPLRFEPVEGLKQQIVHLNETPPIPNLYTHQRVR